MLATPLMRLLLVAVSLATAVLAVVALLDRLALDQRSAERRALLQRHAELSIGAVAPGSALACLDGTAGETIEQACEAAVFASPQSAASASAYTGARLSLLADAVEFAQGREAGLLTAFAAARRAIELDRFGIAAHVLAVRDGCTAERCAAFALVRDSGVLKANLRGRVFEQYAMRHAGSWNKPAEQPVADKPSPVPGPVASIAEPPSGIRPATGQNNLPKTTIPPVSIMDAEPPLSKEAAAAQAAAGETPASEPVTPLPPKRPPAQAVAPPAR
jgi:hypothetical protein